MNVWGSMVCVFAGLLVATGCGTKDDEQSGTGGANTTSSGGGGAGTTGPLTFAGSVFDWTNAAPVDGVEVCIEGNPAVNCSTTAGDGSYLLEHVPDTGHAHFSYSKPAFPTVWWSVDLGEVAEYAWIIGDVSDATISTSSAAFGSDGLAPGKGAILAKIANGGGISNGIADATMSLDGYTAFYFVQGANGREPDAAAAATGTDGMALFFDLPPGAYDVVFQGPAGTTCTAGWGWNGGVASSVGAVVAAGVVTFIQADCQ